MKNEKRSKWITRGTLKHRKWNQKRGRTYEKVVIEQKKLKNTTFLDNGTLRHLCIKVTHGNQTNVMPFDRKDIFLYCTHIAALQCCRINKLT